MNKYKNIVIIGATSAIAQECARIWINSPKLHLCLVGRNIDKLRIIAEDLSVRNPEASIEIKVSDFIDANKIEGLSSEIMLNGRIDILLIAHGYLPNQIECQENLAECRDALEINGISPVLFAEAFSIKMLRLGGGVLAIIGSVAGDRGRKSNYVYGSAKGMIDRYAEGLTHRFYGTALKILCIKPGPTDTPMTAALKENALKLTPVHIVAEDIVKAVENHENIVYTPKKWRFIMLVIRNLPGIIFNRLNI